MRRRRRRSKVALYGAIAGAVVLAYYVVRRPSSGSSDRISGSRTGGPLYRLHVRVPLAYVDEVRRRHAPEGQKALLRDVRRRVEGLGYESTLVTLQDPTDNSIVTLLSRPRRGQQTTTDGVVQIERRELVDEPEPLPSSVVGAIDPRTVALPIEGWLSADESFAVRRALSEESNTRHLKGLASTFEPWAPVAASMLRAKATVLDPRRVDARPADRRIADVLSDLLAPAPPADPALLARVDAARAAVDAYATAHGLPVELARDQARHVAFVASGKGTAAAIQTGLPREIVALGILLTRQLPHGGAIVDPVLALRGCPDTGREGFVSPSALWLAHAAGKPSVSGVRDPEQIRKVYESTEEADPKASPGEDAVRKLRATSMMQRAEKTLHRDRWIRWYRRNAEVTT